MHGHQKTTVPQSGFRPRSYALRDLEGLQSPIGRPLKNVTIVDEEPSVCKPLKKCGNCWTGVTMTRAPPSANHAEVWQLIVDERLLLNYNMGARFKKG